MKPLSALGIIGSIAAAVAAPIAGCTNGSSASGTSASGESCTKTADCQSGLVCVANTCYPGGHPAAMGGSDAAGGGGPGSEVASDAGLSRIGESCQSTRDCGPGLDCVPSSGGASVCDLVNYGLAPSGKTCSGECGVANDCCALPQGTALSGRTDAGTFVSVNNCEDILLVMLGGDASICASQPAPGTSTATGCFYYQTYCNCAANTWTCASARCVYTAPCQATIANTLGGCPLLTRTRTTLNTTCDMPGNHCHTASSTCTTDTDCDGLLVSDEVSVTCRGGDCACYMSACYLKCAKDLDCAGGYACDASTKLCVPAPCSNDGECFSRLGKARAACKSGACVIPCSVDHDCSPSGDLTGQPFNGTVCGPDGVCTTVGCTSDSDCASTTGGVRYFCAMPSNVSVHSAVSN